MSKKCILIIMDGWGKGQVYASDAIQHANVPFVSSLYNSYPNAELITSGEAVGLPQGQMGNSEVGHLNIGAGRIVYQELQRINKAIQDGELEQHPEFTGMLRYVKQTGRTLHIMGLLSDGGVHAHINHLKAILDMCRHQQVNRVMIHVFTDGRDTDPKSGLGFISELEAHLPHAVGQIASVTGRYYAMDRDKRWERVKVAYDALVHGTGIRTANIISAMEDAYAHGVTDEFIRPIISCDESGNALATLQDGDAVFCFNFRTDRCREITQVLTQDVFPEYQMQPLSLHYTTLTVYDKTFRNIHTIFRQDDLKNTLGEVLSNAGKTQIRIAETEKYPHVTFFFNGGREAPFDGESRILCPSPKEVATYDQKPEMSAYDITAAILPEIEKATTDFICLNFANADMVGHTGVWNAVIQAVEAVDRCVERIVTLALQKGYTIFLTADHGNSDYMINEDGTPNTAHTLNPVPLFLISPDNSKPIRNGKLGDLAPTILHIMDIPVPAEMTGDILCDGHSAG